MISPSFSQLGRWPFLHRGWLAPWLRQLWLWLWQVEFSSDFIITSQLYSLQQWHWWRRRRFCWDFYGVLRHRWLRHHKHKHWWEIKIKFSCWAILSSSDPYNWCTEFTNDFHPVAIVIRWAPQTSFRNIDGWDMFTPSRRWTRSFRSHFSVQHCIPRHDAGCLRFREKPEGSPARQDDCRLSLQSHNLLLRCCLVLVWGRTSTDTRSKEFLISPTFLPHVCLFKAAERGGGGCILSGYLIQYFFLAFFFCLNAIALNIYLPFSKLSGSYQKVGWYALGFEFTLIIIFMIFIITILILIFITFILIWHAADTMHGDYDQVLETGWVITFPIRLLFGFVSDSLFAICYLLFAICYLLFAICYLIFAIYYLLSRFPRRADWSPSSSTRKASRFLSALSPQPSMPPGEHSFKLLQTRT